MVTMDTRTKIMNGIQNGARTQSQGQVIHPIAFMTTRITPRSPVMEMPPDAADADAELLTTLHNSPRSRSPKFGTRFHPDTAFYLLTYPHSAGIHSHPSCYDRHIHHCADNLYRQPVPTTCTGDDDDDVIAINNL
jgi:hypothetical protein